jgi:dephospho-CoA kinase
LPEFRVRRKVLAAVDSRVFGLTGGIGSGKSTVARLLSAHGIAVVSADDLGRQAVVPGTVGLVELEQAFGGDILNPDGTLNRGALAELAFSAPNARVKLNAILHPHIQRLAKEAFLRAQEAGHRLIGYDVPLLFETGAQASYRPVVVVDAPRELRRQRAAARDGMTAAEFDRRDQSQTPLEEKVRQADFVIDNRSNLKALERQVEALIPQLFAFSPQ